jgi:hypothetical protein
MSRLTPIAAIFLSLALCACQSAATQSSPAKNAALTATGGTPGNPANASVAGADASAAGASADSGHKAAFALLAFFWLAVAGYILLQVYAGGVLTGHSSTGVVVLGHLMTGGVFFAIRLFDNIVRFLSAEFTGTPRMPVSLVSGNPNPLAIYNSHPAPAPESGTNGAAQSMVEGLGLGLSSRGVGSMGMMQDIRSPQSKVEEPVSVG